MIYNSIMDYKIIENDRWKRLRSETVNYDFNKKNGFMVTYGRTLEENVAYSPFGPFIADIELSTSCANGCRFCYKDNKATGEIMSLETFKTIFHKIPKTLVQIAFGIGDIESCTSLFDIMNYCRNNDYNYVIPNITVNKCTEEQAKKLASVCGAVAVSCYDYDVCFNSVQMLTNHLKQVNIHQVVCEETYDKCFKLIDAFKTDPRLKKLNAIVFLMLKPKGRGVSFRLLSLDKYKKIVDYALEKKINIGFDSCSAFTFLKTVDDPKQYENFVEECESSRFSLYINVQGKYHHCSFAENGQGLDVLNCTNFLKDIWYNDNVVKFRNKALENVNNKISCQLYDLNIK